MEKTGTMLFKVFNNDLGLLQNFPDAFWGETSFIAMGAFYGLENLTEITIPDSVTFIGNDAFNGCKNLKKVKLSENLKRLDETAFLRCSSLEEISIPASVKYVGARAFALCENLKQVIFNGDLEELGNAAFSDCPNLEKIVFKNKNKLPNNLSGVFQGFDFNTIHEDGNEITFIRNIQNKTDKEIE